MVRLVTFVPIPALRKPSDTEKPNRCVRTHRNASHRTVIPKQRQQIEYRRHGSPEPFGTTRIDSLILLFTAIESQNKSIPNGVQTSVD